MVLKRSLVVLGLSLMSFTPALAVSTPPIDAGRCFFTQSFQNWKAPDDKTIYIRVNLNQYYRLDLANRCTNLNWPSSHLITRWRHQFGLRRLGLGSKSWPGRYARVCNDLHRQNHDTVDCSSGCRDTEEVPPLIACRHDLISHTSELHSGRRFGERCFGNSALVCLESGPRTGRGAVHCGNADLG